MKSAAIMGLMLAPMLSSFSENKDLSEYSNHNATAIQAPLESSKTTQEVSNFAENNGLSEYNTSKATMQASPELGTPQANAENQNPGITEIVGGYLKKGWKGMAMGAISGQAIEYAQSQITAAGTDLAKSYVDLDSISENLNSAANVTTECIKDYISYASSSGLAASARGYGTTFLQAGLFAAKGVVTSHPIIATLVGGFVIIKTAQAAIKYYPDVKKKISSLLGETVEKVGVALENPKVLTNKILEVLEDSSSPDFRQKLESAISKADENYLQIITTTLAIDNQATAKNILTTLVKDLMEKETTNNDS